MKNILIKLLFLTVLVSIFLMIYFPRGINGYISKNWKVTLFLNKGVEAEKGQIFANRLARIDFIESARYFSEDEVWGTFLSSVGNPDNLKGVIGSPIPGYIEVKFRKTYLNEKSLKRLITIAENEDFTKEILYGGASFHRMLKIKNYLNISLVVSYIFFFFIIALFLYYLDSDFIAALSKELVFVREHGKDDMFTLSERLTGNVLEGLMSGCMSFGISLLVLSSIFQKFPTLRTYVFFPSFSDYRSYVYPFVGVLALSSALFFLISYFSTKKLMRVLTGE